MKNSRTMIVIAAIALVALLGMGASVPPSDIPVGVDSTRWVKISDTAGIVVDNEGDHDRIVGRLFTKRDNRWLEVIIENSPTVIR